MIIISTLIISSMVIIIVIIIIDSINVIIISSIIGIQKVIPTPDFRISPGGRKHRKTQENREQPGGRNPGVGISFGLLDDK